MSEPDPVGYRLTDAESARVFAQDIVPGCPRPGGAVTLSIESEHWVAFRSLYGFDAFYCMPGIDGAHEKGGVAGEVGRFRRTHLPQMTVVGSLAELNALVDAADRADHARGQDTADSDHSRLPLDVEQRELSVGLACPPWRGERAALDLNEHPANR